MPDKITIHCTRCGSQDVTRDAAAHWDVEAQKWELTCVQDQGYCNDCDTNSSNSETTLEERKT